MKRSPLRRHTPLERSGPPARHVPPRSPGRGISPASSEQRIKVQREGARVMWDEAWDDPVDAAHVIPRSLGGCDSPDYVVGLPRRIHRAYDRGEFDLLPYLEAHEQAHAVLHVRLLQALKITTGDVYVPEHQGDVA